MGRILFLAILIGVGLFASSLPSGATATTLDTASLGNPDISTPVVPGQPDEDDKDKDKRKISLLNWPNNKIEVPAEFDLLREGQKKQGQKEGDPTFSVPLSFYSGYMSAFREGGYTEVEGEWVQPRVICQRTENSTALFWVGLGSAVDLVQTGTAGACVDGEPVYFAWRELIGRSEAEGGERIQIFRRDTPECTGALTEEQFLACLLPVLPNDQLSAEVSFLGGNRFELILNNATQDWQTTATETYTGADRTMAFWIAEASPQLGGALAEFATEDDPVVNFSNSTANESSITSAGPFSFQVTMLSQTFFLPVRAETSTLTAGDTAFSVTWKEN
jgi:Peptidase A4 family